MARILLIHSDEQVRGYLLSLAAHRHHIEIAKNLLAGIKQLAKSKPEVILIGHRANRQDALRLLNYMRENVLKTPVIVLVDRGEGAAQSSLTKSGARALLEFPVDLARLESAIEAAVSSHKAVHGAPPPVTREESDTNLSLLEGQLNRKMKCFAGKNQVFLQSMVLGGGTSRPRIALKCRLRAQYGLNRDVYYEFIRDTCCCDPSRCEAFRRFNAERETA